jgi:hypothetical protein
VSIKWGLSVLDRCSHAIDEHRDHPIGAPVAECGHLMILATALHEGPNGRPCEACATKQFEIAQAALNRAAATLLLARAKIIGHSTPERLERRRCPLPHR